MSKSKNNNRKPQTSKSPGVVKTPEKPVTMAVDPAVPGADTTVVAPPLETPTDPALNITVPTETPGEIALVAEALVAEATAPLTEPVRPIKSSKLLEHAHQTHCVIVDKYMTVTQLQNPDLWSFIGTRMKHMDRIQATSKDNSMIAFGLVTFAQGGLLQLKFYEHYDLDVVTQNDIKIMGYTIRQINSTDGWEIIHSTTAQVLKDSGLPDQNSAITYLQGHMRSANL